MSSVASDSNVKIIVHAGYGKTATTFLQQSIFSKLEDVVYVGKEPYLNSELMTVHERLFSPLYQRNEFTVRARNSYPLIREYGDLIIRAMHARPNINKVVISDENIFDYANYNVELNIYLVERLLRYISKASGRQIESKIMLSIRNQASALQSYFAYDYVLLKDRFKTLDEFISYGLENTHCASFGGYFYDEVLLELQDQFGVDSVKFFVFEQLKENPNLFIGQLLDFLGSSVDIKSLDIDTYVNRNSGNEGDNYMRSMNLGGRILRCVSRYFSNNAHRMGLGEDSISKLKRISAFLNEKISRTKHAGSIKLDTNLSNKIRAMYDASNRRLSALMGWDLRPYGYYFSRPPESDS